MNPLLAPYPVLPEPPTPGPANRDRVDTRTLAFESLSGEPIFPSTGHEFIWLDGIEGLGLPPREIVTKTYPGMDGAKIRKVRTGVRDIFLPLFLEHDSSHAAFLSDMDALEAQFNYRSIDAIVNDGTLNLVGTSSRGERRLRIMYASGAESGYGTDNDGGIWASLGLRFMAVQPYAFGEEWSTPVIRQPAPVDTFAEFPLNLSADVALGAGIPITIGGQVGSRIVVDLVGPASSVTVTGEGLVFSIPAGLADGESARILTDPRGRRALFDGVLDWSRIGPSTTWKALPAGDQELSIAMTGTSQASSARVSGMSLFERLF